jgi:archaemetzincin
MRTVVWLLVLKSFPADLADAIEVAVEDELPVDVQRAGTKPLPAEAWYEPRQRWRADVLLEWLPDQVTEAGIVLGLTTVDISTTKPPFEDWGIFGLGELPGDAAVISTYRLRKGADAEKLRWRTTITAIHEVGHTLGLDHCTEQGCVMQDAEGGIANTDSSTGHLGPDCRARLGLPQ